jgi:hypothetical protein
MSVLDILVNVAVSMVTGVLSAIASWWLLARRWRPRIEWCPTIAKYRFEGEQNYRYVVQLKNVSKRTAMEVKATIRVRIPDLVRVGSTETIPLASYESPRIRAGHVSRWRVRPEEMSPDRLRRFGPYFPDALRHDIADGRHVALEHLLALSPRAEVELAAFGSDVMTWARTFSLVTIGVRNIRAGRFEHRTCAHSGKLEDAGTRYDDSDKA